MLRFGARGRFVIYDNLEKCLDALGGVRDTCSVAAVSSIRQKRAGGSTAQSTCLIDFLAPRTVTERTQKRNRRQSSTSAIAETQRTCLYDFHVEKQGES